MNQNLVTIIQPIQNQECCVLESVVIDISAVESSNLNNLCGFGDEIITPRVKIKDFVESRFPRIHLVWVNFFIDIKNFFRDKDVLSQIQQENSPARDCRSHG